MSSSPDPDATNSETFSKTHISLNVDTDEEEEEESRKGGMIQLELETTNVNVQVDSETEINDDEDEEDNEEEEEEEERAAVEANDDNAIDFTSLVEESRSTFNQANDDFVYEVADNSPNQVPSKSASNDKDSPKQQVELPINVSKSILDDEDCIILDDSSNSNSVPDPASLTFLTSAALKNALTSMNLTTLNVSSSPNPTTPNPSTSDNTRRVLVSVSLIPGQQPISVKVREAEWNSIRGNLIRYNRVDLERMRQDEVIKHAQLAAKRVKISKPSSSQKPAKKKAPAKQMNVIDLNELRQQLSSESVSSVSSDDEEVKTAKKNSSSTLANNSASSQHKRTKSTDKEQTSSKTVTATTSTKSSTTGNNKTSILDRSSSKFISEMNKIPAQSKPKPKSTLNKPTEAITIDSSSNSPQNDDFNDIPACVTQAQAVVVSKLAKSTTSTLKKDINNNLIVASYSSKKTTVESNQKTTTTLNEKESKKSSTVSISTTKTAKKRPGEAIISKETTTKESSEEPRAFKIPRLKNREEETNGDSNKAVDVAKSSVNSLKRKADEIESTTASSNKEKIKPQTAKRSKPMFSGGASILEKLLPSSSSSNSASVTARKKTTSHMSPRDSTSSMSPSSTRPGKSVITGVVEGSTAELTSTWSMSDAMTALLTPSQLPASIEQLNEIRSQFNVDLGYKHGYYSPLFLLAAFVKRMTRSPALNFVRLSESLPGSFSPEIDINGVSEPLRLQLCKLMSRSAGWINLWVMFGFDCWLRETPRGFKPSLTAPVSLECSEAKSIQWVYSMSMSEAFIWYDRVMSRISAPYSQRTHIRFGSTKYFNIRVEFENDHYIESEDTSVEACISYTLHRSHSHFDQINRRLHQTCVKEETQPEVDCTASNGAAEANHNTPATLVGPTWEMTKQNYDEARKTINDDQLLNTIYMRSLAQKILSKPISKKIVIMKTKFVRETSDKSDRDERIKQLKHLSQPRFCNFFGSNINPENRGQMRRIDLESRNRILNDAELKRKIRTLEKEKNVSIDCTKLFQD